MELSNRKEGDVLVVSVKGRMDAVTAPEFEKAVETLMDDGETAFVVDLADLDYISSAGLRSILALAKRLKTNGGSLRLAALQDGVKEVFDISGFSSIIPVFDTVEGACKG
jgi:anti-anti-sigma factor